VASIRKPGVDVIQEFQAVAPALGLPSLPELVVGPAYQVVNKDTVGTYDGSTKLYSYLGLVAAGIVDLAEGNEANLVEFPVRIFIEDGRVEALASSATGITTEDSKDFSDSSAVRFADAIVGDKLIIESGADQGEYEIVALYPEDQSKVKLNSELSSSATTIQYRIERLFEEVEISRQTAGIDVSADGVELPAGLQKDGFVIVDGTVKLNYRALRPEFSSVVETFTKFEDIEAKFGIGQVVPENPLAFALSIALQNTTTRVGGLGLGSIFMTDVTQAHQKALDIVKRAKITGEDVYVPVPLTQEPVVHQLYAAHVDQMSFYEKKKERVTILNRKSKHITTISDEKTTDSESNITEARLDAGTVTTPSTFTDTVTIDAFLKAVEGDILRIAEGGNNDGDYEILTVDSNSQITIDGNFVENEANVDYQIVRKDGLWRDGKTFYDSNADFITDGVATGNYLEVREATGAGTLLGRYMIGEVKTQKKFELAEAILGAPFENVRYEINRDFTVDEKASYISSYSSSFASRRVVMVWPDIALVPTGGSVRKLPGYLFAVAIGALVSGLPAHQGFTNLTLTGFIGFENSSDIFDEDQLDLIAGGGTMILDQEVEDAPLYVRHQLTTDTSSIAFQEFSITKNVDSIAKFFRRLFSPYIGRYNINETLIDMLYQVGSGGVKFLSENRLPKIGAPLRRGSITTLVESSVEPDTVEAEMDIDVPYPFNRLRLKLLV